MADIQKTNLMQKGLDLMSDPKVGTAAKIGAVALVAVGGIAFIASKAIDAMSRTNS